mgnify:CR=1 FL=1
MAIYSDYNKDKNLLVINVEGRFDFSCHKEFRDSYKDIDPESEFVLNMKKMNYLDSSALGMLLLLRDFSGGDKGKIILENCNETVAKVLAIANFDRLFVIR